MKHEVMLNHENKGKLNIKLSTVWLTVHRRKTVGCAQKYVNYENYLSSEFIIFLQECLL